jgi:hypothetical protein
MQLQLDSLRISPSPDSTISFQRLLPYFVVSKLLKVHFLASKSLKLELAKLCFYLGCFFKARC